MEWLKTIAPTIATALGGPLAGMAVSAVAKAIGVSPDEVQDIISSGKLTAEQVASIQLAELELKKQAQSMNLDFAKLIAEDKQSARNMQIATKSLIPALLAVFVTLGFFGILLGLMTEHFKTSDALMLMLGSLATAWTGVMAFYFGSSASSQAKTELLAKSEPAK
jgi:plasmid maintenance system antidote protein VapI